MDAALRRSRLLEGRVDDRQDRLSLLGSLDLSRGSFLLHCAKREVSGLRIEEIGTLGGDGPADRLHGAKGWTKNGRRKDQMEIWVCEDGTSFEVQCNPLDCIVRKAWKAAGVVQVEPPFRNR